MIEIKKKKKRARETKRRRERDRISKNENKFANVKRTKINYLSYHVYVYIFQKIIISAYICRRIYPKTIIIYVFVALYVCL